jgi:hypothetical protein
MKAKDKRLTNTTSSKREKLSLYPLSIEDALRAALQTGKAPPLKKVRTNRRRKTPAKPD